MKKYKFLVALVFFMQPFTSIFAQSKQQKLVSNIIYDQKKWLQNQLPANSVLYKSSNPNIYIAPVKGNKKLPVVQLPTYQPVNHLVFSDFTRPKVLDKKNRLRLLNRFSYSFPEVPVKN